MIMRNIELCWFVPCCCLSIFLRGTDISFLCGLVVVCYNLGCFSQPLRRNRLINHWKGVSIEAD
jgi:hypothetical protein